MPPFTVNPQRTDPYKAFKFRVRWDGHYVAGVSRVSALRRVSEVVTHRAGGDPNVRRISPGTTRFDSIVLQRGRTHDSAFEQWANKVSNLHAAEGAEASLADFRKDVAIDLFNEAGQRVMSFLVYRCWPAEYTALGALEADGCAVAFESLTLAHEGFERDYEVTEPREPSFVEPPS